RRRRCAAVVVVAQHVAEGVVAATRVADGQDRVFTRSDRIDRYVASILNIEAKDGVGPNRAPGVTARSIVARQVAEGAGEGRCFSDFVLDRDRFLTIAPFIDDAVAVVVFARTAFGGVGMDQGIVVIAVRPIITFFTVIIPARCGRRCVAV